MGMSACGALEDVRQGFRAVVEQTYLDIASCAPISLSVQRAIAAHLSDPEYGFDKERGLALVERTRALFAQLINAQADEVALTKNVSEGLNFVANAIDWKSGDNVVVCPSMEHPNNRYLWHQLAHRLGLELRLVPAVGNAYPVEAMVAAIDHRTRLLAVSSVSYVPGFLTQLEPLSLACRQKDVLLLVDAAQSVGPLHTDVQSMGVDALAVSTQKGLLGVYGMGFLYVRSEWAQRLQPASLARFGVDEAALMGKGLVVEPLALKAGARRFDLGNYNMVGVVAAQESLTLLTRIGTQTIQAHTVALARSLSAGLLGLGLPVCQPDDEKSQVHVASLGSLIPATRKEESDLLFGLHQHLTRNHVRASWRNGILRFSMHVYNDRSDVDRVLGLAEEFVSTQPTGR
jgi:cysteine desulfurase/selenocysteine lyase